MLLAGGACAAASTGSAQAVEIPWNEVFVNKVCDTPTSAWYQWCSLGDKRLSNFATNYTLTGSPTPFPPGTGTSLSTVELSENSGIWDVNFSFDPNAFSDPSQPYTLSYDIEITDPGKTFSEIGLDSICNLANIGPCEVDKQVAYYIGNVLQPIDTSLDLTSTNGGASGPKTVASGITKLRIYDTWTVQSPGSLDAISNNFTQTSVPGPLPVMGAGMAFGFSRRLRRRIKACASA